MSTALEITGAVMCATAGTAILVIAKRLRRSRSRCGCCPPRGVLAPWKLRAWALVLPGPGWAARIRHGLGRDEYAARAGAGMAMDHPDWITGGLPEDFEEILAELDSQTWEGSS